MQIPHLHFLHYTSKFCSGYHKYLKSRENGPITKFNWGFFFFNFMWLSYHKMYKEFIVFAYLLFTIFYISYKNIFSDSVILSLYLLLYSSGTFLSYYFYEKKIDQLISKKESIEKLKPYNFFISFIIFLSLGMTTFFLLIKFFKLFV